MPEALSRFKEALEVAISINARPLVGDIFLGMAHAQEERPEDARICAQNAHDLGEELGTIGLKVMGLSTLALAELRLGKSEEAQRKSTKTTSYLKGGPLAGVRPEERDAEPTDIAASLKRWARCAHPAWYGPGHGNS